MSEKISFSQFLALLYADIFDFPLTKQELCKFQITNDKLQIKLKTTAQNLKSKIKNYIQEDGYYFLKGRQKLINLRKQREKSSKEKMEIARRVGKWLKIIPTIKIAAVTGAVTVGNAKEGDDIDFLVVAKRRAIWTTRFLSIILLELLRKRRRPNDKNFKNKICLNMFLDEDHLAIPENERDLFSAHEAVQIKILWSRGDVERRWWKENEWICRYLPNIKAQISKIKITTKNSNFFILHYNFAFCTLIFDLVEKMLEKIQLTFMHSKRTKEVVKDGYLRFHPHDVRKWVLRKYQRRLRKYGLE